MLRIDSDVTSHTYVILLFSVQRWQQRRSDLSLNKKTGHLGTDNKSTCKFNYSSEGSFKNTILYLLYIVLVYCFSTY